ncbi:MAG: toxic anion resistance protein [Erysipelotrichaceae bacterium]|nr:toxic anion resistance protein [Erysipelotrichaceae bacterium]
MEEEKITLTLEAEKPEEQAVEATEEKKEPIVVTAEELKIDKSTFTPEEQKMIDDFSQKIDINDSTTILQYGSAAQNKIAEFSDIALENVRTKDLDSVGNALAELVNELKGFNANAEEPKGILGFFKKNADKIANLKTKYDKAEVNVDRVVKILEDHQVTLLKDIAILDQLYDRNLINYKELTMYIAAGQQKLEEVKTVDLVNVRKKAEETGAVEDAQVVNDLENSINRFEKKLHDLELTRVIALQMAPQIRLVQNNDTVMTEKIQSTIINTIPVWKSQMIIALGLAHSKEAVEAENAVNQMTNQMLKENAENLKTATIEVAKASERGIVDLETLQETNRKLIETLDEVTKIQTEGREKRAAAQVELRRIEKELNQRLTEVRKEFPTPTI